ncbi:TIGR03943 family putative permease subunit [Breznakiellaceae bacterium SP9]
MKNKVANKNLGMAFCTLFITFAMFSVPVLNAKNKLQEVSFSQAVQTAFNDTKIGTFEENVKFTNAAFNTGVIEIKEKMFIGQTNDIYLNPGDYVGKTIKLEGLFKIEDFDWQERPFYYVLRYGPGCCGYDGSAGFEVLWDNSVNRNYPNDDDWVEAVGILQVFDGDINNGIYIALTQLTVSQKRGAEFVRQ